MSGARYAPPEPANLRERAYDAFTQRILSREIRPGQFVSQRELVELTGVSLGAIRELVPRLEAEGLIVTIPQRGMQVAHVDVDLIRNAFQFRLFLEREAVVAFTASASDSAIRAQRDAHEDILTRARESGVTQKLIDKAQIVDLAFHEAIIDHLGNDIVSKAYRVNWIKIRLIRHDETGLLPHLAEPVMRAHLAVIEAIEARDAAGACAALTTHITGARDRALSVK
ncbi:MAG: GntR family transcriptional regulator [Rhizobiales bacterium 65-9]|nr:GntR family transcriptional regulator [Hyphomicrobiales bacterium]OJY38137.1 MAG: GntR family transcriptional regulator [Rhizobiales bacterium 65-9]